MSDEKTVATLEEIRDLLTQQLKRQDNALEMQKEQFSMAKTQFERAEKLNDRAEAIQEKSASLVATGGKIVKLIIPLVLILIVYAFWLVFQ